MMKKIYFGLFLALMTIGGISIFATGEKSFSENENRYLSTFSDIETTDDVEGVLADQFPLRDTWLSVASETRYLSGARSINDTYIGQDGYIFDKCDGSDFDTQRFVQNLNFINKFAEAYGIDTDLVLVPSPYTVLSDELPSNAFVYSANNAFSIAEAQVSGTSNITFYDLRDTLSLLSQTQQVYYKTDHHWTTRAAEAAYYQIFEDMSPEAAAQAADASDDLTQVTDKFHGTLYSRVLLNGSTYDSIDSIELPSDLQALSGDQLYDESKLDTKDKYAYFLGGNVDRMDIEGTGEGSILIVKDSFCNCMVPLLAQKYEHITILDLRYLSQAVSDIMATGYNDQPYDQVMVLYEMSNFAEDTNLFKLARGIQ